ncbi:WG repeat-containing protein [Flavobacterium cerinum]|uniref:WG repeat-containing protein n=1 Tax=Flavobacterium cerinum TaxID=2502784 RepID=A0ABY5INS1_9FLAO|nr:WG repeat-containing protein [Flavobacterium cerinum]UUC44483.1 WG repeat-containing protein [Flavobacterium cerinum]
MKQLIQSGLCLLFTIQAFSQDVTVPYRIGNVFGISDYNGKLIRKKTYDKINYNRKMPKGYFTFSDKDQKGITFNGKTLVSGPDYGEFGVEKNKFIVAEIRSKHSEGELKFKNKTDFVNYQNRRDGGYALFNLKGENLYPDNFKKLQPVDTTGVSSKDPKRSRYALLAATTFDKRYSLVVYDCDKQKISDWLLKDYYKVNLERDSYVPGKSISLKAAKEQQDAATAMQIYYRDGKFAIRPLTTEYSPNGKEAREGRYDTEYGSGSRLGRGTEVTNEVPLPPAYGNVKQPMEADSDIPKEKVVKKYLNHAFEIKDGKLFLVERNTAVKESQTTAFLMPPTPAGKNYSFESIKYGYDVVDTNEKRINQKNLIRFKSGDQYGMLISQELIIPAQYDSIVPLRIYDSGRGNPLYFIVATKDNMSQKLNFGLIDINGKPIIPIQYEELDPYVLKYSGDRELTDYNKNWRFKKNGKYGVMKPLGEIVLPAEYDEIEMNKKDFWYHQDDFLSLKKEGLYGLIIDKNFKEQNIIPPVFPYKVGFFDRNYQKQDGLYLFGLLDSEGKFMCYARKDGFLYQKEK